MFKFIALVTLLFSIQSFAGDSFRVVCKNIDGKIRAQVKIELPTNLFYFAGSRVIPTWILQSEFDSQAFAKDVKIVANSRYKATHFQLHEERNFHGESKDVSGYMAAIWLFLDEKKQLPTVIHIRDFLSVASAERGPVVTGGVVVGHNTWDRLSVLYGEVLDDPNNRQDMALCRLTL